MIAFLHGTLAVKTPDTAYIDVCGVGYAVQMSQSGISKLPDVGSDVRVLTYMQVSDNGIALFGFLTEEEKTMFEQLLSVSGVGPRVALAALSTFTPQSLASAIAAQDVSLIQKIPGVGKKSASRIILELKGSLDQGLGSLFASDDSGSVIDARLAGATEALLSMGFTSSEAELALKGAPEGATESALLQYALKRLGSTS